MNNSKKLLIVDDETSTKVRNIIDFLSDEGYTVKQILNPLLVQDYLINEPDTYLVLIDQHMPELKGLDLGKSLAKNNILSNIPLVMLTGYNEVDYAVEALTEAGFCYFVWKERFSGNDIRDELAKIETLPSVKLKRKMAAADEKLRTLVDAYQEHILNKDEPDYEAFANSFTTVVPSSKALDKHTIEKIKVEMYFLEKAIEWVYGSKAHTANDAACIDNFLRRVIVYELIRYQSRFEGDEYSVNQTKANTIFKGKTGATKRIEPFSFKSYKIESLLIDFNSFNDFNKKLKKIHLDVAKLEKPAVLLAADFDILSENINSEVNTLKALIKHNIDKRFREFKLNHIKNEEFDWNDIIENLKWKPFWAHILNIIQSENFKKTCLKYTKHSEASDFKPDEDSGFSHATPKNGFKKPQGSSYFDLYKKNLDAIGEEYVKTNFPKVFAALKPGHTSGDESEEDTKGKGKKK